MDIILIGSAYLKIILLISQTNKLTQKNCLNERRQVEAILIHITVRYRFSLNNCKPSHLPRGTKCRDNSGSKTRRAFMSTLRRKVLKQQHSLYTYQKKKRHMLPRRDLLENLGAFKYRAPSRIIPAKWPMFGLLTCIAIQCLD